MASCSVSTVESSGMDVSPAGTGSPADRGSTGGAGDRVTSRATTATPTPMPVSNEAIRQPKARRDGGEAGAEGSVDGIRISWKTKRERHFAYRSSAPTTVESA